jgi:hypothetical protein
MKGKSSFENLVDIFNIADGLVFYASEFYTET